MKIYAKQRLEGAILLDQLTDDGIKNWAVRINAPDWVSFLLKDSSLAFKVLGYNVYKKVDGNDTFYFVLNDKQYNQKYTIVFYSQVQKSTSRNKMFKSGMHQSLIWKAPGFAYGVKFAVKFLTTLIDINKELLMTDMKQTFHGRVMWINLLLELFKTYDCYYALSAPSDVKCIIKIDNAMDIDHYEDDIVQPSSEYAYRTAFILKKGIDPRTVLRDPINTRILTCQEAEDLGIFTKPQALTDLEKEIMLKEYEGKEIKKE